ncbi:lytic transglycosylase domain-containing protein [Rhizobium sp. TRM95111]|uniref:lytic transglycosylase domain-containing protein n=1 Tax=Rhizobium alarense TaxID=2846851 RepID=UPI001F17685B|nr:lytic transglycosylase domain-containing protein [Rhizobium alarense]MCF3639364.1 lytic transglycosylase domain-containing protein [Rhizobium alarense]
MADFPAFRIASLACVGLVAALAGCTSVADDVTTAKGARPLGTETATDAQLAGAPTTIGATAGATSEVAYAVLPSAKPGTENTPEGLPTPVAAEGADAVPVSALAGARPLTGAAAATAALAGSTTLTATTIGVSAMEPGFDSGEPEGLEQLVATRKIVPVAKPVMVIAGVTATNDGLVVTQQAEQPIQKSGTPIDALITKYADIYGIPETLLHRVVKRESRYNPRAYNRGHYGLMQIKYATARSMGYDGPADGLFDAETNIKYAAKYLRGAWLVADDKNDGAVMLYASGYYYHAKRKGLLEEAGLR